MRDKFSWMAKGSRVRWALVCVGGAALAGAIYLITAHITFKIGFPLDDAWIHQTYARNLIWYGEWSFFPGISSAGSTSPLWTALLATGYLFTREIPYFWTYFCGFLALAGIAIAGEAIFRKLVPNPKSRVPWMGLFLVFEWHLVWAAVSGMETAWMAMMVLITLAATLKGGRGVVAAGFLAGISVWVRPDGLTLLGPVVLIGFLSGSDIETRVKSVGKILAVFLVPFLIYLAFNWVIGGAPWPNTYYAKQAEYAVLLDQPLILRIASIMSLPMIGAGILLLPGFVSGIYRSIVERNWMVLTMALWWVGYSIIYAMRLPLTYQHGRYLIPAMPVFFLLGYWGTHTLLESAIIKPRTKRLSQWGFNLAIVGLLAAFLLVGAGAYGKDVAIIETEMVTTANWLTENVDSSEVIAVHDIGAIGYFSPHRLIDLAGLITPEITPFIRDEEQLKYYLDSEDAGYLVTFPGWYPELSKQGIEIFSTGGMFSVEAGGENMVVYRWVGDGR